MMIVCNEINVLTVLDIFFHELKLERANNNLPQRRNMKTKDHMIINTGPFWSFKVDETIVTITSRQYEEIIPGVEP